MLDTTSAGQSPERCDTLPWGRHEHQYWACPTPVALLRDGNLLRALCQHCVCVCCVSCEGRTAVLCIHSGAGVIGSGLAQGAATVVNIWCQL